MKITTAAATAGIGLLFIFGPKICSTKTETNVK